MLTTTAKIPKPKESADDDPFAPRKNTDENDGMRRDENGVLMPQTLVRIPVLQQPSK
jgi:DASH complex subunit DAD2